MLPTPRWSRAVVASLQHQRTVFNKGVEKSSAHTRNFLSLWQVHNHLQSIAAGQITANQENSPPPSTSLRFALAVFWYFKSGHFHIVGNTLNLHRETSEAKHGVGPCHICLVKQGGERAAWIFSQMCLGPGQTSLLPSPGNYPGNGFCARRASFLLPASYCLFKPSPRWKHLLCSSGEKPGQGGKRGLFAVVFCLESGWSRGPSAAAPPNSHRKKEIILHRDKQRWRQEQQFRERIAWPLHDVTLLEATARLKSSQDAVFMEQDSASSSPKDNFIWRFALLSIKTELDGNSREPHAGSPQLSLLLQGGCTLPCSEPRPWLAPSRMKPPGLVGTRQKSQGTSQALQLHMPQPLLLQGLFLKTHFPRVSTWFHVRCLQLMAGES